MRPKFGHKSFNSAINGVINFQTKERPDLIIGFKEGTQYRSKISKLIRRFLKEKNLHFVNNGSEKALEVNANKVQDNWSEFKKWILKQEKND